MNICTTATRALASSVFAMAGASALAQHPATGLGRGYPEKPVRLVVPFPPGGAADIMARQVAQKLTDALGAQFIVDNRAGAGGAIGAEYVSRAVPDGYTLLQSSASFMSINPHINTKLRYHPLTSFTPVILIGHAPNVLAEHPSLPVKSVKDLIGLAKARPGVLSFASSGTGTILHLTGEWFMQRANIRMLHVPYKGAAPAVIDTLAGQVTMLFAAYPSIAAQERAGKLKALAVTSLTRLDIAPHLPTMAEAAALPGFESNQWWGISGPAGLPAAIVTRLNAELDRILRGADIKQRFAVDGAEPDGGAPNDFAVYLRNDHGKWGEVIKTAGIKGE
ncbi:MAG: tripartite tricarboxylate transporter substrate binding protein [Betaproteobacteria bacterium]|nr:tripartite tricarboxylate transporter substrate binding protein [Betaproteobacteria bacterium]